MNGTYCLALIETRLSHISRIETHKLLCFLFCGFCGFIKIIQVKKGYIVSWYSIISNSLLMVYRDTQNALYCRTLSAIVVNHITIMHCCVIGCFNHSDRGPDSRRYLCRNHEGDRNVSFYRIPAIIQN